ncbi:unnamed protein product [Dicrocoelium dendriticum]|nr:unnamed protein product [Dicrocoelium dendriticum]
MAIRCKFCNRVGHIDIVPDSVTPYNAEDSGEFKTIVTFECRGVDLLSFSPRIGWSADSSKSETKFANISLANMNWCDYDVEGSCEVSILDVESRFIKLKH